MNCSMDSSLSLFVPSLWLLFLHFATTSLSCDLMPRKFISNTGEVIVSGSVQFSQCRFGSYFYDLFFRRPIAEKVQSIGVSIHLETQTKLLYYFNL